MWATGVETGVSLGGKNDEYDIMKKRSYFYGNDKHY